MAAIVSADDFNVSEPLVTLSTADNFNVAVLLGQQPTIPTNVVSSPLNTAADLTWTASVPGSLPIIGYRVVATQSTTTLTYDIGASATEVILADLTNALDWTLNITALTSTGSSPAATAFVTPSSSSPSYDPLSVLVVLPNELTPDAPVLNGVNDSDGVEQAVWTAPVNDGGSPILYYEIQGVSDVDTVVSKVNDPNAVSGILGPVQNGHAYVITVRAWNAAGPSASSNAITGNPALGLPPVGEPDQPPPDEPPIVIPQPLVYAFPPLHLFRPSNFGLTPDQATEAESA